MAIKLNPAVEMAAEALRTAACRRWPSNRSPQPAIQGQVAAATIGPSLARASAVSRIVAEHPRAARHRTPPHVAARRRTSLHVTRHTSPHVAHDGKQQQVVDKPSSCERAHPPLRPSLARDGLLPRALGACMDVDGCAPGARGGQRALRPRARDARFLRGCIIGSDVDVRKAVSRSSLFLLIFSIVHPPKCQ
jgi:hypothetical protein